MSDPNYRNSDAVFELLKQAIRNSDLTILQDYIQKGIDLNACECSFEAKHPQTPLEYACEVGSADVVRVLIEAGADVHHRDNLSDLEHFACSRIIRTVCRREGDLVDVLRVLLDAGAEYGVLSTTPGTRELGALPSPLSAATIAGNLECVRLLLERGVSPMACGFFGDGDLPRDYARQPGSTLKCTYESPISYITSKVWKMYPVEGTFKTVVDLFADYLSVTSQNVVQFVNLFALFGLTDRLRAIQKSMLGDEFLQLINRKDLIRFMPLMVAVGAGQVETVEYLLERGADPNVSGEVAMMIDFTTSNDTALMTAISLPVDTPRVRKIVHDLVRLLVAHGAHVDARGGYYNSSSPLLRAIKCGRMDVIHMLVGEFGADVNVDVNSTPFSCSLTSVRARRFTTGGNSLNVAFRSGIGGQFVIDLFKYLCDAGALVSLSVMEEFLVQVAPHGQLGFRGAFSLEELTQLARDLFDKCTSISSDDDLLYLLSLTLDAKHLTPQLYGVVLRLVLSGVSHRCADLMEMIDNFISRLQRSGLIDIGSTSQLQPAPTQLITLLKLVPPAGERNDLPLATNYSILKSGRYFREYFVYGADSDEASFAGIGVLLSRDYQLCRALYCTRRVMILSRSLGHIDDFVLAHIVGYVWFQEEPWLRDTLSYEEMISRHSRTERARRWLLSPHDIVPVVGWYRERLEARENGARLDAVSKEAFLSDVREL